MPRKEIPASLSSLRNVRRHGAFCARGLIWLSLCVVSCGFPIPAVAQSQGSLTVQGGVTDTLGAQETGASAGEPNANCRATSAERCLTDPEPLPSALKCDLRVMTNPQHRRYCQPTMGNSLLPICPLAPFS